MKYDIAKQWVEALRSGKYDQTNSCLADLDGFCCLGVLCDVSGLGEWVKDEFSSKRTCYHSDGKFVDMYLSPVVVNWAGMQSNEGSFGLNAEGEQIEYKIGTGTYSNLADANDDGVGFDEIADFIEANWEKL